MTIPCRENLDTKVLKMKKAIIAVVSALLLLTISLCSCSSKQDSFVDKGDGRYVDNKTAITYHAAIGCYEPIAPTEEVYGTMGDSVLYRMSGIDPQRWICDNTGSVLYAEGESLPELGKMNIARAEITESDTVVYSIEESAEITRIIQAYESGDSIRRPMVTESALSINWRIRFADETIGVYYVLAYIEFKEDHIGVRDDGTEVNYGKSFIFNRFDGTCVPVGDALDVYVSRYLGQGGAAE